MKRFGVLSPEYDWVDVIVDGQGPTYTDRDYVEVEAENRRDARVFGLRLLKALPRPSWWSRYGAWDNPFHGLDVIDLDALPEVITSTEAQAP